MSPSDLLLQLNETPWDLLYEAGIAMMEEQESFEEALILLDKAAELRGPIVQTFASRAVVLERLQLLERSFAGNNDALTKQEESRLFDVLQELPPAIQSVLLSASSLSFDSSFDDQIALAEDVLATSRGSKNAIDTLPPELLTQIGRHLVHEQVVDPPSGDLGFALVAVSRRWRSVFLRDPTLWGRLVVHPGEGRRKVRAFLDKGPLESFELKRAKNIRGVFEVLKGNVSSITRFETYLDDLTGFVELWDLWCTPFAGGTHLPFAVTRLTLRRRRDRFLLDATPATPPSVSLFSLVHLSINVLDIDSLFSLLQRLPNLQSLAFQTCSLSFYNSDDPHSPSPAIISLPPLTSISFEACHVVKLADTIFLLPSLVTASTDSGVPLSPFFFPPPPHPTNVTNLTTLINWSPRTFLELSFISHLKDFHSLRTLNLSRSYYTDATLRALVWPERTSGREGCCPLLEDLDLSYVGQMTGGEVIRLVNSRAKWWEMGRCASIKRLDVRGTGGVDKTTLDWLHKSVKSLSRDD